MLDMKLSKLLPILVVITLIFPAFTMPVTGLALLGSGIVAGNDSASTPENVSVMINVLQNDSCLVNGLQCPDGMHVQSVSAPANGVATKNPNNTVTYSPNPNFFGSDSFTYTAADNLDLFSGTGTVSVTITPVGVITVTANRVQASYWDPCFATTCSYGTGPGAAMYIELCSDAFCSIGHILTSGFADENGYTFTGLTPGVTYYVYPADCTGCHGSAHDVVFQHWGDGNTVRPLAATTGMRLDAWYSCTNNCA